MNDITRGTDASQFLLGDDVIMYDELCNSSEVPNGTKGKVAGYSSYITYIGHHELYLDSTKKPGEMGRPGSYDTNGSRVRVKWENGNITHALPGALINKTRDLSVEENRNANFELYRSAVFLNPLPILPIWPGDIVSVYDSETNRENPASLEFIQYQNIGIKCIDGETDMPIYNLKFKAGYYQCLREHIRHYSTEEYLKGFQRPSHEKTDHITRVVKRGNYWAWFNDKSQLKFNNLNEEVDFFISLGFGVQVKNPESGSYGWTKEQVQLAKINGKVDWIFPPMTGFFGLSGSWTAYNFPNLPELVEKLKM